MELSFKKYLVLIAAVFLLAFAGQASGSLRIEQYFDARIGKYVDVAAGQVLVKFKPSVSAQAAKASNTAAGAVVITRLPGVDAYQVAGELTVEQLLKAYKADPSVEYVEPNFIYYPMSTTPNDPSFSSQWGLDNIKAPQSWDVQKGTNEVIIAVIDSGADMNHEDLKARVVTGYNYNGDNPTNDTTDLYGHGTHVAGIVGATTNNGLGVAGVTWNCRLMILKVFDANGQGDTVSILVNALAYAADNGAKVANMSLAGPSYSSTFYNGVQYAHGKGCVIVAAAGNDGDTTINYPASYDNVISVAAVDRNDLRTTYSDANAYVDVCAPGGSGSAHSSDRIFSTMPSYHVTKNNDGYYNDYDTMQGTSMASPFVAGFAGLIYSQNPSWTNTQVENLIFSSVDHLGAGAAGSRNDQYGYGRINIYKAFNTPPPAPPTALLSSHTRGGVTLTWTASSTSNLERYLIYRSLSAAGPYTLVASADAAQTSCQDLVTQEGTYYYKVSALDASGLEGTLSAQTSITVTIGIADAYVYPNPLVLGASAEAVFGGLSGNEIIRIYTLAGELVNSKQLQGAQQWNWHATNAAGKGIARGVYLYLITRPDGAKRVGKIAVVE
jgi:thermitase